jgi:hypothetical protein
MDFGDKFDTFINQIFGDGDVREIITEVYPNNELCLLVVDDRLQGNHHVVKNLTTNKVICSKTTRPRIQNPYVDVNDNLCQSYSLARYRNIQITRDKIQKQMDIIQMYREILNNVMFINKLNDELLRNTSYKPSWRIYKNSRKTHRNINLNKTILFRNIHKLLDEWENGGYRYFIRHGNDC